MRRRARASLIVGTFLASSLGAGLAGAQEGNARSDLSPLQKRLLSGFASFVRETAALRAAPPAGFAGTNSAAATNYTPGANGQCANQIGPNFKVNQDCTNLSDSDLAGRGQAKNEAFIAQNPMNPHQLVAAFNDYRRGDGTCGVARSTNGGTSWQDSTVPSGFVRGDAFGVARQYFHAAGDPSVAWDTKGNVYLSCQMFLRGRTVSTNRDESSGLYVFRSTGNAGASWNFTARPVIERNDVAGTGATLLDKQLMTVDNTVGSPFQDRVYVTWTDFAADGTAYIYASHSSDYGEHFSAPVLVSSDSALCTNTYGAPTPQGNCNFNQNSQPFAGPDGALYVVWSNFNNTITGNDNRNQLLLAKSTDGGATFGAPVKVADYYDLPDCSAYQQGKDSGRACVPEKGATANSIFRASNYPSGAVDPTNANRVVVAFGSYINVHSNETNGCVPGGFSPFGQNLYSGVKTAGACNNDVLVSVSSDGGSTFDGATTDPRRLTSTTPSAGQATSSQWFQWIAFSKTGTLVVSYYDRQYGSAEVTGFSDVSVSASKDLAHFGVRRATSSSMPPPTQFSGLFWGDYAGLSALDAAHPIWSDTRNPEFFLCPGSGTADTPPAVCTASAENATFANTQDAFTASVPIP
jgi:hypothetical protein